MAELAPAYRYRAIALAVHDGDTFTARVDVGFRAAVELELRIADLYSPELRDPAGPAARAELIRLLTPLRDLIVETRKARGGRDRRSFERYIADVWIASSGVNVREAMNAAGYGGAGTGAPA